jgi:hypothetical protein
MKTTNAQIVIKLTDNKTNKNKQKKKNKKKKKKNGEKHKLDINR